MDAAQWQQELGLVKPMEEILMSGNPTPTIQGQAAAAGGGARAQQPAAAQGAGERRARPAKEKALNCPRCNSTHTKFCYYNNYSLTQPRYFCKTCRRYWTEGGSLRNVPVGGGSRKNKRSSASNSSTAASKNPKITTHDGAQDLNLSFSNMPAPEYAAAFPSLESGSVGLGGSVGSARNSNAPSLPVMSAMDLLRSTGYYMAPLHMPVPVVPEYAGAALFGQSTAGLGFSVDASSHGNMYGGLPQESTGRLLFPFEDLKPALSSGGSSGGGGNAEFDPAAGKQAQGSEPSGFWSGMIGGAGAGAGASWG